MNPNGLSDQQVKQGYSTIPGNFDPVTGQLKTSITSASLAPQPSPDLSQSFTPQANLSTPVVAEATANQQGFQNDYQRYLDLQNQGQDNTLANMIAGVDLQSLTGRGGAQADAESRLGVNQFNQSIADLSSQRGSKLAAYNQTIAQQRAEQANLEAGAGAKGLTTSMLGGQQAALARVREAENQTAAAEIGLLDAQILGTQGKLEAAQNAANRAVDLMYQDREASVNTKLKQIELYTPLFNASEKKKADALTFALNKENERLQTEKDNTKAIENMVINASSQSAPQDLVNRARKAKTPSEAAMILGQYAGDFYKTELLKQQIATEKAQKANYDANAEKTRTETGLLGQPQSADSVIATLPKATQERYYKLQGDFDTATKAYRGAIDSANSITALSKDATSQDQTAIIFQYMKTLDPTSTVREGEFALVAATAGLGDRAVNALKRLDDGQRLNESQIKDIVGATKKLSENAKQNLDATSKEFDRRAAKFGLPTGLFYEPQEMAPQMSEEANDIRKKLELANPALKKMTIPGTDILKLTPTGGFDFKIPTKQN